MLSGRLSITGSLLLSGALVLGVLPGCGARQSGAAATDKPSETLRHRDPDVVILLIDTLRADRVPAYGYKRNVTPTLDALVKEAVVFENAYAASPWTLPTVVSLMTSTFPCEHGVTVDRLKPSLSLKTMAERFTDEGYGTATLFANIYAGAPSGMTRGFSFKRRLARKTSEERIGKAIEQFEGMPLFMYIHRIEVHDPQSYAPHHRRGFRQIDTPRRLEIHALYREYRKLTRVDFSQGRPLGTTDTSAAMEDALWRFDGVGRDYSELYDTAIGGIDDKLAKLIQMLKDAGRWDNTLLVVMSDHGEEFGEHGAWLHDQSVYEELLRVPLIVRFPRGEFGGRRVRRVTTTVDLLPTLADYLNKPAMGVATRGESLMPAVRGQDEMRAEPRVVGLRINLKKYHKPWREQRGDLNVAMRWGSWKGIWNVDLETLELYDLSVDPGEKKDQSAAEPARAEKFRATAQAWYETCRSRATEPMFEELDEETIERLRALGYID